MLFEIAIRTPLRKLFTYESDLPLQKGMRVRVPFRSKEVTGFVWRPLESDKKVNADARNLDSVGDSVDANKPKKTFEIKKVIAALDDSAIFDDRSLEYFERSALYYGLSLGELLSSALPKAIRDGKALTSPEIKHFVPSLPKLSEAQEEVRLKMSRFGAFSSHLLLGETGSGKTEIYLHLIEKVLEANGQVLFLVPEISLTPQMEDRLYERLGAKVTVFHSQQTEKKREQAFLRAHLGHPDVFLGARSALLLPFRQLQLIIVDEEHDSSFKQFERAAYHARDLAILRAKLFQIPIVLGSATPSLESYARALDEEMQIHRLPPYFRKKPPSMKIIDLKKTWMEESKSFVTQELHDRLENILARQEQALLFLNRRGSASQRLCVKCGAVDSCKHCSVTLTIHRDLNRAICHWCGFQSSLDSGCGSCASKEFFFGGIGTKEVEAQLKLRFPEARIARLDRDEAQKKDYLAKTLRSFAKGDLDFLIGTQMISKGIDIPKLSFVGVIFADQGWGVPDFRALERSYQLFHQLKGRAGRRGQEAEFLIQTLNPQHPLFQWLENDGGFEAFAKAELELRKTVDLPPYARLALLTVSHKDERRVESDAEGLVRRMQKLAQSLGVHILGPTPAPISKWKGVFRYHILLRAPLRGHLTTFVQTLVDETERIPMKSKLRVDRDPYQFM